MKLDLKQLNHTDVYLQSMLVALGQHYGLDTFVETGTSGGNTVEAVRKHFRLVLSVEKEGLSSRFKDVPNVRLYHGSSSEMLPKMLEEHEVKKALFWLDAHGDGKPTDDGDQVPKELQAIERQAPDSLVVIDDITPGGATGHIVNFSYPLIVPVGWQATFVECMSVVILHRGGYNIPSDLAFDSSTCWERPNFCA